MHEAVLEDVFMDDALALGRRHQGHELRLQVGGEARIDLGRDVDRLQPLRRVATDDQAVLRRFDLDARLDHLVGQGGDQVGAALGQAHLAPGHRRGKGIGAHLDSIGNHRPGRARQGRDAGDGQHVRV